MTRRKREKGIPPADVNVTMVDTLFPEAQNARIRQLADHADALSSQLLGVVATTGKTLEVFLAGHPVQDLARLRLLAPLERDGVALAELLRRIQTRQRMALPPMTVEQFAAGVGLQMEDGSKCTDPQPATADGEAQREVKHLLSEAYQALAIGGAAMEAAATAMEARKGWDSLPASERSTLHALRAAAKKSTKATEDIAAWRRASDERSTRR